jgi:hypothetical protein
MTDDDLMRVACVDTVLRIAGVDRTGQRGKLLRAARADLVRRAEADRTAGVGDGIAASVHATDRTV